MNYSRILLLLPWQTRGFNNFDASVVRVSF